MFKCAWISFLSWQTLCILMILIVAFHLCFKLLFCKKEDEKLAYYLLSRFTTDMRQSKTLFAIDERDGKSLETVFLIAICRQSGDE